MKNSRPIVIALLLLSYVVGSSAQQATVTTVKIKPDGVEFSSNDTRVSLNALAPTVVRLRYAPLNSTAVEDTFSVLPNAFPDPVKVQVTESADGIVIDTGAMQVKIQKSPLRIMFVDPQGQVISEDQANDPVVFDGHAFRVRKSIPIDDH